MLILCGLDDGLAEGFWRSPTDDVVQAIDVPPAFPSGQQARDGVGQTVLVRGHDDASRAARHALHVAQHEGRGYAVGLSRATSSNNNGGMSTDELSEPLRVVKVDFLLGLLHHLFRLSGGTGIVLLGRLPHTRCLQYLCSPLGTCAVVPVCAPAGGEWA